MTMAEGCSSGMCKPKRKARRQVDAAGSGPKKLIKCVLALVYFALLTEATTANRFARHQ